ncbi:MAG: hypothetical protein DHS20C18_42670 [Saprospiraceae bacterium]|nr:MAG: hypothetical protein DHS20C18_42670 [Saprospiraceae bacterium]
MKIRNCYTFLFLCISYTVFAQQDIFPDLDGQDLFEAVVETYKPTTVLPSGDSRDTLYSRIYGHDDSLTCVYTGFTIYLDPTMDPSVAAFMDGGSNGLNLEHTYPQGMGAGSGNANSDMHHLYPTRIDVNSIRGSHPLHEIPDGQTERWYYQNQYSTNPPGSNLDLYSEYRNGAFEPREDHKGNAARAMFYFYTMYRAQADAEDPNFFNDQRADLCQWHLIDPVDDAEWSRTMKIASYQDDKPNPFILDCTLAARLYCLENLNEPCSAILAAEEVRPLPYAFTSPHPNPARGPVTIEYQLQQAFQVNLILVDPYGQQVRHLVHTRQTPGAYKLSLETNDLPSGIWYLQLQLNDGTTRFTEGQKLVILR